MTMVTLDSLSDYYINKYEPQQDRAKRRYSADDYYNNTMVYLTSRKTLVFIAGLHVGDLGPKRKAEFVKFLDTAFKKTRPGSVLVELPESLNAKELDKLLVKPRSKWMESEWMINFAKRYDATYRGMDLETKENIGELIRLGKIDDAELALFVYFLFWYHSMAKFWTRKNRALTRDDIYDLTIHRILNILLDKNSELSGISPEILGIHKKYKGRSLADTIDRILRKMTDRYVKSGMHSKLVVNLKDPQPYIHPYKKYRINEFVSYWDANRDRHMMAACLRSLRKNDVVLAIAGSGHINRFSMILLDEIANGIGSARMMSWAEFSKLKK